MTKINPGSNVHEDNDTRTAHPGGMQDIEIPEPKKLENNKYQCTLCNEIFKSREDYISHALAKINQPHALGAPSSQGIADGTKPSQIQCPDCGKTFKNHSEMERHRDATHHETRGHY